MIQHVREIFFGFSLKLKENFTYFIGFRQCNKLYALNYMAVSLYANSGEISCALSRESCRTLPKLGNIITRIYVQIIALLIL